MSTVAEAPSHAPPHSNETSIAGAIGRTVARTVEHSAAIRVEELSPGRFRLQGPILEREAPRLLQEVRALPGVSEVQDQLSRLSPVNSTLRPSNPLKSEWGYPSTRSVSGIRQWLPGALGLLALAISWKRGKSRSASRVQKSASSLIRVLGGVLGGALVMRALTRREVTTLFGLFFSPRIELRREILIPAPAEAIFSFITQFTNYPKFMSFIDSVEVRDDGKLHWRLRGPLGVQLEWDAEVLSWIHLSEISWKSLPRSALTNEGRIRIEVLSQEPSNPLCRVEVGLLYAPPFGVLGYAGARWMGFDPRSRIDLDLSFLRTLILDSYREQPKQKIS